MIPWNKGLTKTIDPRVQAPRTAFKRGNMPYNKGLNKTELANMNKRVGAWPKGVHRASDTKQKIVEANRGRRAWNRGITKNDPRGKNLRGGRPVGLPPWNKGKKGALSKEALEHITEANKREGKKRKDARRLIFCERCSQRSSALWQDHAFRQRILEIFNTEESKKRRAQAAKKRAQGLWKDSNYRNETLARLARAQYRRPNGPERQLQKILDRYFPHDWKYTGDGSVTIEGFSPDFTNCNGLKAIIEVFGDYWHNRANNKWYQTELGKMMAYGSLGYKCLVVWEHELVDELAVFHKVKVFMKAAR